MKSWARAGALLAPLALFSQAGCDVFSGSVVALAIALPPTLPLPLALPNPSGGTIPAHLQMWARVNDGSGSQYVRLAADIGTDAPETFPGFQVVQAVNPNDPCLIRGIDTDDEACSNDLESKEICGAQLFSRKAQIVTDGTTADQLQLGLVVQARKVTSPTTSFEAVDSNIKGLAPSPLLALVRHNPDEANDPRRSLPAINATNAEDPAASRTRFEQCTAYRKTGKGAVPDRNVPNLNFYVGNPRQYTKPLSGTLFGFFSFSTSSTVTPMLPNQSFSGITFSVPTKLDTIEELLVTLELPYTQAPPTTPALTRIVFQGVRQPDANSGRGVIRLVVRVNANPMLNPPVYVDPMGRPTNVGTAAILTNLESSLD